MSFKGNTKRSWRRIAEDRETLEKVALLRLRLNYKKIKS
jgi:hypothetical protein